MNATIHIKKFGETGRRWPRSPWLIFLLLTALLGACAPRVRDDPVDPAAYPAKVRLACVGDSITACDDCWPVHLRDSLGDRWDVQDFSVGGGCVLSFGGYPYLTLKLPAVLEYEPDVVVILLGTNDSRPRNWYYKKDFEKDYKRLIQALQQLESNPQIWICLPTPMFPGQWGFDDGRIREMQPVIRKVARKYGIPVVDLYTPLMNQSDLFPDQIHPNGVASKKMAAVVHQALTGAPPVASGNPVRP